MKRIQIIIIMFLVSTILFGHNLLSLPESVVYDSLNNRYLISNWGNGNIVQIDSNGTQSNWLSNVQCYAGLHIRDSVLYVACREYGVKGFNLNTGENVLNVDIIGATNINDITSDNSGNLYVSYPTGDAIYKINIVTEQYWLFANSGLDVPNGLYFDEPNNRLLVVSYRMNSPIQEISFADSTVSIIVYPGLNNLDGISQDNDGNFYVSSWYNNRVYKFDSEFANSPAIFSNHGDDPADIYFDKVNNVLAVPLFFTHQIEFVEAGTGINQSDIIEKPGIISLHNYPNPFNPSTTISFELNTENAESAEIVIYNLKGQKIKTLFPSLCHPEPFDKLRTGSVEGRGEMSITWYGTNDNDQPVTSGIYLYKLKINGKMQASSKMILLK
ncbi:MAG: SMP-30/gluconolactonase/LRE family protein [Candidatus Cloacimonetes bacterium]|nr:SMP-30/gluconolactonase/LRE family protein [Candidatus Cloacimonadota bacterium]